MRIFFLCSALVAIYALTSASAIAQVDKSKSGAAAAKIAEPTFPDVTPGELPRNLKIIRVVQARGVNRFELAQTPAMCLSRLSVLVDAAGGTEPINQYASDATILNVAFQSYIGGEISFHCVGNDGSGMPDRHLYSISLSIVAERPRDFMDIVYRVGAQLYGWKASNLHAKFEECTNKAGRRLQKDAFGVIPDYGAVKGMECYLSSKPKIVLFAPDLD